MIVISGVSIAEASCCFFSNRSALQQGALVCPVAHGAGVAGIPTGMTVLALGRLRLTFFPFTALWRTVDGGCRAEQRPCPLMQCALSLRAGGVSCVGVEF